MTEEIQNASDITPIINANEFINNPTLGDFIPKKNPTKRGSISSILEFGFSDFSMDDDTYSFLPEKTVPNIKEDELVSGKIKFITKEEVLNVLFPVPVGS